MTALCLALLLTACPTSTYLPTAAEIEARVAALDAIDGRVVPSPPPSPPAPAVPPVQVPAGGSVWDRLAQCESGGDWSINTGNGYSGGLQWHPDTWRRAGGTEYAAEAWQATREQEIKVAEAWLERTSWEQWPACSRRLGLRP